MNESTSHICLRTKHSLTSSLNTKKGNGTQLATATQAKRLEMKWRPSREESLLNLYKRQNAVFTAQASSYVTITADSYRLVLKERAFPKGNYITVELHTTLGTILVHNAERHQSQRTGYQSLFGTRDKHAKELSPKDRASGSTAREPLQAGEMRMAE